MPDLKVWPKAGRLRIVTVLATPEAAAFGAAVDPKAPFAIMDEILDDNLFDLNSAGSELPDAMMMMIVGVSRALELG